MVSASFGVEPDGRSIPISREWSPTSLNPSALNLLGDEEANGTTASAAMQVMLTCLGIAALTMPHLFAQVGWGLGIAVLAVPAAMSCLSMRQIVLLGEASGQKGMASAFAPHLGGKIGMLLSGILLVLCELIVAAGLAIPCDILPTLSSDIAWLPEVSKETVGIAIVCLSAIASLAKDLSVLDRVLKPSILLFIYLMLSVVVSAGMHGASSEMQFVVWEHPEGSLNRRLMTALATTSSAFGAEAAILAIYFNTAPQFRKPIEDFNLKVIDVPMLLLFLIYVVFGFAGYSEYGSEVESNLLKTMESDWWAQISKIGLSVVNIFRVPLFNIVQWYTVLDLMPCLDTLGKLGFGLGRTVVLTFLNVVSLLLFLFLSDFGKVLGFLGGGCAIPICTLLPGFAWLMARYCSGSPLQGSYRMMDGPAFVILAFMSVFYVVNMAPFFE